MATRTLGIKYEVVGFSEAANSIEQLKQGIKDSLRFNREAVREAGKIENDSNQQFSNNQGGNSKLISNNKVLETEIKVIRNDLKGFIRKSIGNYNKYLRPQVRTVRQGFLEGIGGEYGRRFANSVDKRVREAVGLKPYQEEIDISDESASKIGGAVAKKIGVGQGFFGKPGISKTSTLEVLTSPLKNISFGFYEGIGNTFGDQFAQGLSNILEEELDYSMERKGQVTGKAISYTATEGIDSLKNDISKIWNNFQDININETEGLGKKFETLFKNITKTITSIGDSYVRGYRKGAVQIEALRQIQKEIAENSNQDIDLEGKDKMIFTVSGFAGEKGERGKYMAEQLKPYVNDKTKVVGVSNEFTDVLSPSDKNSVLWGISALANLAKINLKGFNPDAVKLAAQVVNTISKNPNVEIDLLGHSAGGFVVEEAQEILSLLGYQDKVKSRTVGTPNLLGNLDNVDVEKIIGDNDFRIKPLEEALEYVGLAEPTENIVEDVRDHFFQDYLDSDDFLEAILGNSLDRNKLENIKKTRVNKPKEENFITDLREQDLIGAIRSARMRGKGQARLENELESNAYKNIKVKDGVETVVTVIGGFAGAGGKSGQSFANTMGSIVKDPKTQYVGLDNKFTDVVVKEEVMSGTEEGMNKSIFRILDMFAKTHQIGYNPDAIKAAAQIIDLQQKNPELNIKVAGYSGGGYVAEDVIKLLKDYGLNLDNIEVIGIGTPELPGAIQTEGFNKILGEEDNIFQVQRLKELNEELKKIFGFDFFEGLTKDNQNVEGINRHFLDQYLLGSEAVQNVVFSNPEQIKELTEVYQAISEGQKMSERLTERIGLIQKSGMPDHFKLAQLEMVRKEYTEILKTIVDLAKYAKTIGGGKYFTRLARNADKNLKELGIEYDPDALSTEDNNNPSLNTAESKQKYQDYLINLIAKSNKDAEDTVNTIINDLDNLDNNSQQSYIDTVRKTFNLKARIYRDAVRTGQLEIAREQGEKLIELAALLKKLYAGLDENENIDGQVKSKLLGMRRYATSVQREVIQGSNANGRSELGLTDIFEAELVNLETEGTETVEGFVDGILNSLDTVEKAATEIGEAATEAVRQNLNIRSPSGRFEQLGKWVVAGFRKGLAGFNSVANDMEQRGREVVQRTQDGITEQINRSVRDRYRQFRDSIAGGARQGYNRGQDISQDLIENTPEIAERIREIRDDISDEVEVIREDIASEFEEELLGLEEFVDNQGSNFLADNIERFLDAAGVGILNRLGSLLFEASINENVDQILSTVAELTGKVIKMAAAFSVLKSVFQTLGIGKLVEGFTNLREQGLEVAAIAETLDKRIMDVSGSASRGAENIRFITDEAYRLSKNLNAAKENYAELLGATAENPLSGVRTEEIYKAFANISKTRGFSDAEEARLFKSIRSIIGKEFLSQEEVRQEIAELLPEFPRLLAQSQGVSVPQLNEMIENRQVKATDALPKVAAQLLAKSALDGKTNTAQAIEARLDSAISSFRQAVGEMFLPIQKFGYEQLTGFFEWLTEKVKYLEAIVAGAITTTLIYLLQIKTVGNAVQKAFLGLIKVIWQFKIAIAKFAAELILVQLAINAVANVWKIAFTNPFPEIEKDVESLTLGINKMTDALNEAAQAKSGLEAIELPTDSSDLKLNEGLKLPEWKWLKGVAGGDRLNLDNLIRKRYAKAEKFTVKSIANALDFYGFRQQANNTREKLAKDGFTTLAEKKQNQFVIQATDARLISDKILEKTPQAIAASKKIAEYDREIEEIQSKRLLLLSGDTEGLEKSLAAEKEIQEKRDVQLKIITQQQQNLQASTEAAKKRLEILETKRINQSITQDVYNIEKAEEQYLIEANAKALKAVNAEAEKIPKQISVFSRELRNTSERIAGFMEERDRANLQERTEIITQGIAKGEGQQVIQLKLDKQSQKDLQARINKLQAEIAGIEARVGSAALDAAKKRVEEAAKESGGLTTDVINRLKEEERSAIEKQALEAALLIRTNETELFNYQQQQTESIQQSRNSLKDFNRTISDYFFNLTQQLTEARIEAQKLMSQIFATNIKNKLKNALIPGSDSFLTGIVDGIANILDQAQSLIEQSLGLDSAENQLKAEQRSLELEMADFLRNINGANEALLEFTTNLKGGTRSNNRQSVSSNNAFPIPNLNLNKARISSGFGWRTIHGGKDFHEGIDIAVKGGTEVVAVRDGLVKYIKPLADQMQVGVESVNSAGEKVTEWFIHLGKNLNVKLGDRVSAGQKLGEVAHTSNYARRQKVSTGDHLDYRIQVGGKWINPREALKNVSVTDYGNSTVADAAQESTDKLVFQKQQNIEAQRILQELGLGQDLDRAIANQNAQITQQFKIQSIEEANKSADLQDKVAEFEARSRITGASDELAQQLRGVAAEFRGVKLEGIQEIDRSSKLVAETKAIAQILPDAIVKAQSEYPKAVGILQNLLTSSQKSSPQFEKELEARTKGYKKLLAEEQKIIDFLKLQGELKIEAEELGKQSQLQQLKTNIATERGTNELRRQNEIFAEQYRLKQRINQIKLDLGDTEFAQDLIKLEQRQSEINIENINRGAYDRDREYEKQLLDLNSGIAGGRAGLLRNFGFDFQANKLERESAIAQENFRYEQEIEALNRRFAAEPEKLELLKQKAEQLNNINLEGIKNQFKTLGETIEFQVQGALEEFFVSWFQDITNAGELLQNFVTSILKAIAQIAAKQAASRIIGAIFGGGFRDGGTVGKAEVFPNYIDGGRVVPDFISDRLKQVSAPIRSAFNREGSKGVLGVFTPGEEILSIRTGEAGRYQALKKQFGINPLDKIFAGNFADGGTIDLEANLLSSFDVPEPRVNLRGLGSGGSNPITNNNSTFNLSTTIVTPDADSFRASEYQIEQDRLEMLRRNF